MNQESLQTLEYRKETVLLERSSGTPFRKHAHGKVSTAVRMTVAYAAGDDGEGWLPDSNLETFFFHVTP